MKRKDFEDRYLNKYVFVQLFDGTKMIGNLYKTEEFTKKTGILDMPKRYFIGENIRENGVRFRKSHITKIRELNK